MESNFHRIKFNCEIVFSLSLNAPHSKQIHAYFNFHQTLFCWNDKFAENVAAKKLILFFCLFALFSCMFAEVHFTATSWRVKSPEFKVEFLQRSTWLRVEWFTCSLFKAFSEKGSDLSVARITFALIIRWEIRVVKQQQTTHRIGNSVLWLLCFVVLLFAEGRGCWIESGPVHDLESLSSSFPAI